MGVEASGLLIKTRELFYKLIEESDTMGDNVSFKVFLKTGEEQEEEVRRFVIDKGASTSYDYLVGKLEVVFPQIKTSTFSIHWTDEDGDNVTITSDEELIIALTEMSGPLYKLRVNIKKTKPMVTGQESDASGSSSAVHYGVTCDGCECKPIIGNRYKCVVCDDFDLCETCHAAGKHPGHNMMKITEPGYVFPQRLFKRMQTLQERAKNLSERQQRKEEKKEGRGQSCPARGFGPRGRGLFRPFGPMYGGRGGGAWAASAVPAFDAMMKGWTGEGMFANNGFSGQNMGSEEHQKAHEEATNAAKAAHDQAHAAAAEAAKASADASAALNTAFEVVNLTGSEDYLKNVGNFVAAALDPLGIDVKIDIETPEGRKSCQVSSATSSSSSTTTVEDNEEATKEEEVVDDQGKESEASKKATTPSDDEEEWTVVSDKKDKEDDHQGSLYPDLSETKPEEAATESSPTPTAPVANHPDPRIQVALQAMMNMGFTNDGGWLSSLLEAKNGDIGKVLDILQPVKK